MPTEFLDDERVFFRHNADYHRDKHTAEFKVAEGVFVLTSHRLLFESTGGKILLESPWSSVVKDKYSSATDPRCMIRIELAATSSPQIFVLTGTDNLRNAQEEARMRISNLRKPYASSGTDGSTSKFTTRKQSLLEADVNLKRQYTELVVEQKIMTDDEFWQSKINLDTNITTLKRGRLVSILSDIDKCKTIKMTPEIISSIFEMYPAVKRAYDDKVPTEYTEVEFWDRYFTSEYYAQDKGGLAKLAKVGSSSRTDDIFEKYNFVEPAPKQRGRICVDADIDLIATKEDFHHEEIADISDRNYSESAVVKKYNRHSTLHMREIEKDDARSISSQLIPCHELTEERKQEFLRLTLGTTPSVVTTLSLIGKEEERCAMGSESAFGRKSVDVQQDGHVEGLSSYFPPEKRALRVFEDDKKGLVHPDFSGTGRSNFAIFSDENISAAGRSNQLLQKQNEEGVYFSNTFRQYTFEMFTQFTELLRHFYSIIAREGSQAPIPGSDSAEKINKILKKLEDLSGDLKRKKDEFGAYDNHSKDFDENTISNARIRCINEILVLRTQAIEVWKVYCSRRRPSISSAL